MSNKLRNFIAVTALIYSFSGLIGTVFPESGLLQQPIKTADLYGWFGFVTCVIILSTQKYEG